MVPLLYQVQLYLGANSKTAFVSAVATSLAVIIVSGAFAARIHYRNGLLEIPLLAWTGLGTLIGGIIGSNILIASDDAIVRLAFGIFLWTLAAAMFLPPAQPKAHLAPVSYKAGLVVTGTLMGIAAALFGIGGSVLVVPALVTVFGVPIHRAIATATALIVMTALVGAGAYLVRRSYGSGVRRSTRGRSSPARRTHRDPACYQARDALFSPAAALRDGAVATRRGRALYFLLINGYLPSNKKQYCNGHCIRKQMGTGKPVP